MAYTKYGALSIGSLICGLPFVYLATTFEADSPWFWILLLAAAAGAIGGALLQKRVVGPFVKKWFTSGK